MPHPASGQELPIRVSHAGPSTRRELVQPDPFDEVIPRLDQSDPAVRRKSKRGGDTGIPATQDDDIRTTI